MLRSLAFGPLPKAQVQASQRIAQSTPTASPNVSGLGSGGGGDYDAALTVGGPLREPEGFSPVFPDLFEANLADLPGADAGQAPTGGEPDFTSDTAQNLAAPRSTSTGMGSSAPSGPPGPTDFDAAAEALSGVNSGVRALRLLSGGRAFGGGQEYGGTGVDFSAGEPGSQVSGGELGLESFGGSSAVPTGGNYFGGAAGGLQGLQGLLNLYRGIQSGSPGQLASGALGTAGGANAVSGSLGGPALSSSIGQYLGPAGAFLGGLFGPNPGGSPAEARAASNAALATTGIGTAAPILGAAGYGATAGASAAVPALAASAGPVGALLGPALYIGMGINQALNPKTNYGINQLGGQIGPQVTGQTQDIFSALQGAGDLSGATNEQLEYLIPRLGSDLASGYNTTGAGAGTATSQTGLSRYLAGLQESDPTMFAAYQQAQQGNQASLLRALALLQQRGVPNEVIGQLMAPQLGQIWDAYNPAIANNDFSAFGPDPTQLAMDAGDQSEWAGAYGGPTWAALRKFIDPNLLGQFGVTAPGYVEPAGLAERLRQREGTRTAAAYQDFTSGGG